MGEARGDLDDDLASLIAQVYEGDDLDSLVARLAACQAALDAYDQNPITSSWFTPEPRVLRDGAR